MPETIKPLPKDKHTSVKRNQAPIRKYELPEEDEGSRREEAGREKNEKPYEPIMSWI